MTVRLVNIGDVYLGPLETVGGGACAKYDLLAEQQKIREVLSSEIAHQLQRTIIKMMM